jgi:hypothetical protein
VAKIDTRVRFPRESPAQRRALCCTVSTHGDKMYREATVRLIIPTELRAVMGRRLMAGAANTHTSTLAENAQLH